eukprot:CAMPEP_0116840890 /NCGR_PEP_ID=MMETSP0418-20121206/10617_1 /TAXON_ID=1158023 /ORGANISM="Astrosyne radiata, Strain 13vi08-1A" /LENGTH=203 /DNA_ID=CAMNT_0004471249 /DNA_START=134 /DNA_END=745 /DNA_ORIENTATION=-
MTNPAAWTKVAEVTVEGKGVGYVTPLPLGAIDPPLEVAAGEIQAIYINVIGSDIVFGVGFQVGREFVSNDDLGVLEGAAIMNRAGVTMGYGTPYRFNGVIQYYSPDGNSVAANGGESEAGSGTVTAPAPNNSNASVTLQGPPYDSGWECEVDSDCKSLVCDDSMTEKYQRSEQETETIGTATSGDIFAGDARRNTAEELRFCL